MTQYWIDEKKAEIEDPEQGAPAVILIFEDGAPWLEFPVAAGLAVGVDGLTLIIGMSLLSSLPVNSGHCSGHCA